MHDTTIECCNNTFVRDTDERSELRPQAGHSRKMESVGHLAAGVAHEISTPIQFVGDNTRFLLDAFQEIREVLAKYSELLEAAKGGTITEELIAATETVVANADLEYLLDEVPSAIGQSLDGVDRVATIVRAMKAFSHPGRREMAATDIRQAIQSAVTISRNEWEYVAEIETNFDPDVPPVICRIGDLIQVFLNLIVNAAHAISDVKATGTEERGKIAITTRVVDGWVEIRFSDTGTGIAEVHRANLYDAFYTTKEVGQGTGQGLAIAHSIVVEGHDGTIAFETEVGKGTTFIVRLPIQPAKEVA